MHPFSQGYNVLRTVFRDYKLNYTLWLMDYFQITSILHRLIYFPLTIELLPEYSCESDTLFDTAELCIEDNGLPHPLHVMPCFYTPPVTTSFFHSHYSAYKLLLFFASSSALRSSAERITKDSPLIISFM